MERMLSGAMKNERKKLYHQCNKLVQGYLASYNTKVQFNARAKQIDIIINRQIDTRINRQI